MLTRVFRLGSIQQWRHEAFWRFKYQVPSRQSRKSRPTSRFMLLKTNTATPRAWRWVKNRPETTWSSRCFRTAPKVFFIFHRSHCHRCSFKIINISITQWARGVKNELSLPFAWKLLFFSSSFERWKSRSTEKNERR